MRLGTLADTRELEELAQLDSASLPAMPWLIGERAERVVVALSLGDGAIIANPFVPTADVIALLRVRALQLSSNPPRRGITWQRRHLRSFALR
jgi:hypothetical protein